MGVAAPQGTRGEFSVFGGPTIFAMPAISANDSTARIGSLRELRREAGFSQQVVAERAGCSIASVRLFERGFAPDRSEVLIRILNVLAESQGEAISDGEAPATAPRVTTSEAAGGLSDPGS